MRKKKSKSLRHMSLKHARRLVFEGNDAKARVGRLTKRDLIRRPDDKRIVSKRKHLQGRAQYADARSGLRQWNEAARACLQIRSEYSSGAPGAAYADFGTSPYDEAGYNNEGYDAL